MELRKRQLAVSRVGRAPKGDLRRLQEGAKRRPAHEWDKVQLFVTTCSFAPMLEDERRNLRLSF